MSRKLLWPMVRKSLKGSIAYFFDFEFQKNWYDPNYKHAFWDSIDYYIIDYLMNLKDFVDEAHEQIGISLYNEEEADRIQEYLRFFNDNIEGEMPDDYYVNHQDWPQVVEGAREIVAMLEENEKKYDYVADCRDYDLELDRDRQEEVSQMIEEVVSWSAEKKQAMQDRIKNLTYLAFTNIEDSIRDELALEQDKNKKKVSKMIDGVESWSVEQKQAMKDRMENARDEKIGQVIKDVMAEVRSAQGDDKN